MNHCFTTATDIDPARHLLSWALPLASSLVLSCLMSDRGHGQQPVKQSDSIAATVPDAQVPVAQIPFSQVTAILSKYCAGCHNASEHEGEFSVSTYASLMVGAEDGPVVVPGNVDQSKLLQLLSRQTEPAMPPEEEPQPSTEEINLLRRWVEQGAVNDATVVAGPRLDPPHLTSAAPKYHHVAAACGVADNTIAVGLLGSVQLWDRSINVVDRSPIQGPDRGANRDSAALAPRWVASGLSGKVNSLRLNPTGELLVVGCGIAGVGGEALILDIVDGHVVQRVAGHNDAIYCAALSPDGRTLATGSYDRSVILWDVATGKEVRLLSGHNGAIHDLDFDNSGQLLASASADQTVKLWHVATGQRLDTLGQPEGEQRCVRFSPDGQTLVAAGADKQIRKWQVVSRTQPTTNPLLVARFAHESDVLQLAFLTNGRLLSTSTDLTVKLWEAEQIVGLGTLATLSDVPVGLCLPANDQSRAGVMQLDGRQIPWSTDARKNAPHQTQSTSITVATESNLPADRQAEHPPRPDARLASKEAPIEAHEAEPNNSSQDAMPVTLPVTVAGVITGSREGQPDQDLFRFHANAGQAWIVEVAAAQDGSPLDSRIDILDSQGQPVERTRLHATRESYFTFRGKDSSTSDDFRLHKWEDMELDEYLYAGGEVNRLWLYPRGPDSGFKVYPGAGQRHAYFDTTPLSHALGQTTYIVRELAPGEVPLPNGLPVFPVFYENDDDAQTLLGKDSRLTFTAPSSGDYVLRVRDARDFGGDDFLYRATIRQPQPDFKLKLADTQMSLPVGSGREWSVDATRIDGLDGRIAIELINLPAGVIATNPLIIEAGQQSAVGALFATQEALAQVGDDKQFQVKLIATAHVGEHKIERALPDELTVSISDAQEVQLRLVAADHRDQAPDQELDELVIYPGQTISARVVVERNGTESRIELGKEDSGRNLPHGAFVDNIGLNGLLIPEGQTEREFFITAAPKVVPGRRQFHLKSATAGKPTSRPIWLNVVPTEK